MFDEYFEALNLTYLPRQIGMELAPFPIYHPELAGMTRGEVVKASPGHYPQPFLISVLKNWRKDRVYKSRSPNFFYKIIAMLRTCFNLNFNNPETRPGLAKKEEVDINSTSSNLYFLVTLLLCFGSCSGCFNHFVSAVVYWFNFFHNFCS